MNEPRFYELIAHLWKGGHYSYFWIPDSDNGKIAFWFDAKTPRDVSQFWKTVNVYFGIHPSRVMKTMQGRATIQDIECVNCLFAEFDLASGQSPDHLLDSIMSLDTPPSVVVFSGGGYHAYWLLAQTYHIDNDDALQRIRSVQSAWIDYVGSDDAAKDLARVLRIPGTYNRKPEYGPNYPQTQINHFDMEKTYELDDLVIQVESIIESNKIKRDTVIDTNAIPIDLDDTTLIDKMLQYDAAASRLWSGDMSAYNDDHSVADSALCSKLAFWFGKDPERMDRVFRRSSLFRPKWLRDDYRDRTIEMSIRTCAKTYTAAATVDPNNIPGNPVGVLGNPTTFKNGHSKAKKKTKPVNTPTQPSAPSIASQTQAGNPNYLLDEGVHDEGNALCVRQRYDGSFLYNDALGWLTHTGKFWKTDGAETDLERAITETLIARMQSALHSGQVQQHGDIMKKCIPNANAVRSAKAQFRSLCYVSHEIFDMEPDLLNCTNGIIDLRTGQLESHTTSQRFTHCATVDYKPDADYTEWVNWLSDATSVDVCDWLQMAIGYSLTGHTREEILIYLFGPPRSGKGLFTEVFLALLGAQLAKEADFTTFTADRTRDTQSFDLAPLRGCRLIAASESKAYERFNEAVVKRVTGGNVIRCAFKHQTHFEYKPQFKIWLSSNQPVNADPDDDAVWGRVRIVEFPNSHLGKEDKSLKERMRSQGMLEGVLAWAVAGAIRWYQLGSKGLPELPTSSSVKHKQRAELDHVQQWLDERCDLSDSQYFAPNKDIRSSYETWCQENGVSEKKSKGLTQSLIKKKFNNNDGKVYRYVDVFSASKISRGFFGIKIL